MEHKVRYAEAAEFMRAQTGEEPELYRIHPGAIIGVVRNPDRSSDGR